MTGKAFQCDVCGKVEFVSEIETGYKPPDGWLIVHQRQRHKESDCCSTGCVRKLMDKVDGERT